MNYLKRSGELRASSKPLESTITLAIIISEECERVRLAEFDINFTSSCVLFASRTITIFGGV